MAKSGIFVECGRSGLLNDSRWQLAERGEPDNYMLVLPVEKDSVTTANVATKPDPATWPSPATIQAIIIDFEKIGVL